MIKLVFTLRRLARVGAWSMVDRFLAHADRRVTATRWRC
jgi:hypothetical protein